MILRPGICPFWIASRLNPIVPGKFQMVLEFLVNFTKG